MKHQVKVEKNTSFMADPTAQFNLYLMCLMGKKQEG